MHPAGPPTDWSPSTRSTFGNAVELIVGVLALKRGELRIVQTSLLGSILSNLLLVLGCSFLAGGLKFKEQQFQATAAQASSSLMVLGTATLVIPAAYRANQLDGSLVHDGPGALTLLDEFGKRTDISGLLKLSRGTAIVSGEPSLESSVCACTVADSQDRLAFAVLQILLFCYASYLYFQLRTHHYLFEEASDEEEEEARMNIYTAVGALVVVTVVTSFCADYRAFNPSFSMRCAEARWRLPRPAVACES